MITGNLLYNGKEKKALRAIESYVKTWDSTQDGLVKILLENCGNVLQGYKLMEIWATSSDFRIASVASRVPESLFKSGREVQLKNIKILSFLRKQKFERGEKDKAAAVKAELAAAAKAAKKKGGGMSAFSTFTSRFGFGKKKEEVVDDDVPETPGTPLVTGDNGAIEPLTQISELAAAREVVDENDQIKTLIVLGIQYDGTEYCRLISYGLPDDTYEFTVEEMKIVVKAERDIYFTIYEIDADCNILHESVGSFQLTTFKGNKRS